MSHLGKLSLLPLLRQEMSTSQGQWQCPVAGTVTIDLRSITLAMRHRLVYPSIYMLGGLSKGDGHASYTRFKEYGILYLHRFP